MSDNNNNWIEKISEVAAEEKRIREEMHMLDKFNDFEFLKFVLIFGNRRKMNETVPDGKFKAFDIADNLLTSKRHMTREQRFKIRNLYLIGKYGMQQRYQ